MWIERVRNDSLPARCAAGFAAFALVTGLKYALHGALGVTGAYLLYPLAVVAGAWVGGFAAGVVAALLSAIVGKLLFDKSHTLPFNDTHAFVQWLVFIGQELLMAGIVQALHRARTNAELARDERRRAQAETQAHLEREQSVRREAETVSRLKDDFLATMSHELRTPLSAILGWVSMLRVKDLEEHTRRRALETIERNAEAQARLIEDVLDVSRIIRGNLRLRTEDVDPSTLVREAMNVVRPAAEAKGIHIETRIDPSAGNIVGDAGRLQQVLWNLLSNAVKFTPASSGGRVEVTVAREGQHLLIRVSDTGEGITAEFLPHVFERFRQADASLSRGHGGLGLGLAIVRHLIELHGGSVSVTSPGPGRGTTFSLTLPSRAALPSRPRIPEAAGALLTAPSASDEAISLYGMKVVVVDDDLDARDLIAVLLREAGAEVTIASSAAEGLQAVVDHLPDVLLSDLAMPNEDGYSLIRRVRDLPDRYGGKTHAVALTAHALPQDTQKALAAGFDLHVPKPVAPAALLALVAAIGRSEAA
jgi:signal transduction histidine kinase/ActR/RegA family two-component response regulator